jgi:hypothetical protein
MQVGNSVTYLTQKCLTDRKPGVNSTYIVPELDLKLQVHNSVVQFGQHYKLID